MLLLMWRLAITRSLVLILVMSLALAAAGSRAMSPMRCEGVAGPKDSTPGARSRKQAKIVGACRHCMWSMADGRSGSRNVGMDSSKS